MKYLFAILSLLGLHCRYSVHLESILNICENSYIEGEVVQLLLKGLDERYSEDPVPSIVFEITLKNNSVVSQYYCSGEYPILVKHNELILDSIYINQKIFLKPKEEISILIGGPLFHYNPEFEEKYYSSVPHFPNPGNCSESDLFDSNSKTYQISDCIKIKRGKNIIIKKVPNNIREGD